MTQLIHKCYILDFSYLWCSKISKFSWLGPIDENDLGNQPKKLIDQEMIDISAPCHLYWDNIAIIKTCFELKHRKGLYTGAISHTRLSLIAIIMLSGNSWNFRHGRFNIYIHTLLEWFVNLEFHSNFGY